MILTDFTEWGCLTSIETFLFSVFFTKLMLSTFTSVFIFHSRKERSLALLVGTSAMNLTTVIENALYWTSTFTVKKEGFPGLHWPILLVSMPTWPGYPSCVPRTVGSHPPGPYKDGRLHSVRLWWWWLLIFPLQREDQDQNIIRIVTHRKMGQMFPPVIIAKLTLLFATCQALF